MPLKGQISIHDYIQVWKKCLDIFGHNEVYTMVIAGLGESSRSILEGVELAASCGVVASIVPHTPMRKAVYEDLTPPAVFPNALSLRRSLANLQNYGLKLYGEPEVLYLR
jgi:biotin synthase-related radical SAM superfamily protein